MCFSFPGKSTGLWAERRARAVGEDAKKAKQDEAGAVIPDAIVNRRQKKKEKTFEYEERKLGVWITGKKCLRKDV